MKRFNIVCVVAFGCILCIASVYCKKRKSDCPGTPPYQALTSSAKEWFPYTSNRNLIFENAALVRDTLQLTNYFAGDDDIWNGDECPTTKGEFLRGNIFDRKSSETIKVEIGNTEQVIFQKKTGFIYYFDSKRLLAQQSATKRFEASVVLNNKTYTSVLVFECSTGDDCTSAGITKFYFSKTRGLVAFERNSVLFTLR
jgi:hypothetical protein